MASGETKQGSTGTTCPSFRLCFALARNCFVTCSSVTTEGRDGGKEETGRAEFIRHRSSEAFPVKVNVHSVSCKPDLVERLSWGWKPSA